MAVKMLAKRIDAGLFLAICVLGLTACQTTFLDKPQVMSDTLRLTAAEAELTAEYETAVIHYKKLYAGNPSDPELWLALARNLRYSGDSKNAIVLLENVKPDSTYETAHKIELGKAQLAAGNSDIAIRMLQQAAKNEPKNWEIYSALGIAYDLAGNFSSARSSYETAMGLSSKNATILNNFALSVASSGDLDGAIKMLKNAPRLARHNPQIRQNLAMFYGIKGDLKSAQALGRMDLDEEAVQRNLLIYSQLGRK